MPLLVIEQEGIFIYIFENTYLVIPSEKFSVTKWQYVNLAIFIYL